jgi:hypothetical protein
MINSGGIWYTIKEGVIGEEFGVFWVKAEILLDFTHRYHIYKFEHFRNLLIFLAFRI